MSPRETTRPGLDAFGDALPSQALGRCGTHRFWHPPEEDGVHHSLEAVSFSPDSQRLVSASGRTARVWNREDGRELAVLSGHRNSVYDALYVSDTRIATASTDGTVRLWDAESGTELRQWSLQCEGVVCLALSPDGRTLLAATRAPDFAVIDLVTEELVRWVRPEGAVGATLFLGFSPDGTQVISFERTFEPSRLCAFDTATWTLQWSAMGASEYDPGWAVFSPDGQRVFCPFMTAGWRSVLRTFDAHTGALLEETPGDDARRLFLSDGTLVRVLFGKLQLLREGQVERELDLPTVSATSDWEPVLSPDERWVTFSRGPSTVLLIELSTGRVVPARAPRSWIAQLTFSPDDQHLLTSSDDGTIRSWNPASGRQEGNIELERSGGNDLYLSHGRALASGGTFIRDVSAGTEVELEGGCSLDSLSWSEEGGLLAHLGPFHGEQLVHVHDTRTGKLLRNVPVPLARVEKLAPSRTGRFLAAHESILEAQGWRTLLRVWDLERGTPCFEQPLPNYGPRFGFSPDEAWLALVDGTPTLVLIDLTRPEHRLRLESPTALSAFAFSREGHLLATGDRKGRVRVWSTSGELLGVMEGHRALITALAFSSDGTLLASGSADTTALLWSERAWRAG